MSDHKIELPTDISIPSTSLWAKLPVIGGVLAVVGLGATLGVAFGGGEGKAHAMFSYLWAFEVFLALALGALVFVLIDWLVRAQWASVVKRIAETMAASLPLFLVLFIPIATIGFHELYPWTHELTDPILAKKRWFLSNGFWFGRAAFYFVVWAALGVGLYRRSLKIESLKDNPVERDKLVRNTWMISAPGIILWALTQSLQAIDWLMSLQPHWYSTIFGVYYFAASILAFFAFMALVSMALQKAGVLKTAINAEHYHDLGKFMFGYTVFWAYIAFSQFILIWYANLPEETEFYLARLHGGWESVSYLLPLLHFFVPFLYLLSRHVKRNKTTLAIGAVWVLVMHCVDFYWLVLPNLGAHGEGAHEPHLALAWTDFAALIGMGGAFLAVFSWLLTKNKVVNVADPRLPESLAHENY
jgi:hypothetical protein